MEIGLIIAVMVIFVLYFAGRKFTKTLGFRNNNPFNIYYTYVYRKDYLCWEGEPEPGYTHGHLKFFSLDDGLEAGYRLIYYYFKQRNTNTYPVSDFMKKYAENSTNYIIYLEKYFGTYIELDEVFEFGKKIIQFENGTYGILTEGRIKAAFERAKLKL